MSRSSLKIVASCCAFGPGIFAGLLWAAAASSAQVSKSPPNFAPSGHIGWAPVYQGFMPPASGPGPVMDDPAHPYVTNAEANATGKQPTFQIADIDNPILQPWAKEELRKRKVALLGGRTGHTRAAECWPLGMPAFLVYQVLPTFIVQSPERVVMFSTQDHEVRRIHLNRKHSERVKPSWYGESVGHYEGSTLVVDTIGINDKTYIDHYRTPHTDRLHVVERFRLIDGGMTLEVNLHVEDEGAFTTPWNAIQRFRRTEEGLGRSPLGTIGEYYCAENPYNPFNHYTVPIPQDDKPDF